MEFFGKLFHLLFGGLNDTDRWNDLIAYVGTGNIYVVLFLIIFAETGLVVTPFLPGDSLLFAIGAIGARESIALNLWIVTPLLIVAAIIGDAVNYWVGYKLGPAVFKKETGRLLNKQHLLRAQEFYERYGGKTIILARFVPIVRTFAPFVAGIGRMNFFRFWLYNIVGGIAWVVICILAGVFFGRFEFVQKRFELVILAIIGISVLPVVIEFARARQAAKRGESALLEAMTIGKS
ncbi:MAG: VTT domain-containing protein, partial [Tepidisphaeraceae bacterium]